jgi:chemotaxis signal transduction protein
MSTPEMVRAVLEARARELARVPEAPASVGEWLEVVTFSVGESVYALRCTEVLGLFRVDEVARTPGAHGARAGLTLWRGELLMLFDLEPRGGVGRAAAGAWVVVLAGDESAPLGLLADAAPQLVSIPLAELRPSEPLPGSACVPLSGITHEAVLLIDSRSLFQALNPG